MKIKTTKTTAKYPEVNLLDMQVPVVLFVGDVRLRGYRYMYDVIITQVDVAGTDGTIPVEAGKPVVYKEFTKNEKRFVRKAMREAEREGCFTLRIGDTRYDLVCESKAMAIFKGASTGAAIGLVLSLAATAVIDLVKNDQA